MSKELQGQILEIVLLVVVLCCILVGSNHGLILSLYNMVKNLLILATTMGVAPVIAKRLPETLTAREGIGYAIALVVSIILFNILARVLHIINDTPIIGGLNKLGGAAFGALTGFFAVWTILALLGVFQEFDGVKEVVQAARANQVAMWFQECNPLPMVLESLGFPVI